VNEHPDQAKTENQPPHTQKAVKKASTAIQVRPAAPLPVQRLLPQFRVLLHNDAQNDVTFVVRAIVELTPLSAPSARDVMLAAHAAGVALVLTTHKERAELYQEQFASKGLTVTIEPEA